MSAPSTAAEFVKKWRRIELKERSAAQAHFRDLCHVLGQPTPEDADPKGEWYCFEKGATKTTGGDGWADVWMRQHFGWEYKGKGKDLTAAYAQLQRYAPALENPPLLIVSDMDQIVVHTNWTNTVPQVHPIPLEKLPEPEYLQVLRWAFTDPERLRPGLTTEDVTKTAAGKFAGLAHRLRERGYEAHRVAHFLNRLVFCLFAEDAGLLQSNVFTRALEATRRRPETAEAMLRDLFRVMHKGGNFGPEYVEWFNGGLFDSDDALPLTVDDIDDVLDAARLDWSSIEPSIFGTLFERGLDPSKRAQLGAHYTDAGSIMRIVDPVIKEPLLDEWGASKAKIKAALERADKSKAPATKTKARKEADQTLQTFMHRLGEYRVLDPACGSGNFLYLALQTLKDIEHRAALEAEELGMPRGFTGMNTGVQNVHGIELNTYAAELARLTVWIGEIQWMLRHGVQPTKNPILQPLQTIECRDAILNEDGTEPQWPTVDAIVGNPPFLGSQRILAMLGQGATDRLRRVYAGRVPPSADYVCYWFAKATDQLLAGSTTRVGLVSTNSIRGGANRFVLERIRSVGSIFNAWSDEEWINEGAAVRVSITCFDRTKGGPALLDGCSVPEVNADLTAGGSAGSDLTRTRPLEANQGVAFQGSVKVGNFDVPGCVAREWLHQPNATGRPNSDVLRPLRNARDLTKRPRDAWLVDFNKQALSEAAGYELPFRHVEREVKPFRKNNPDRGRRENWWLHGRTGDDLRAAVQGLQRVFVTPRVAKHRMFVWSHPRIYNDDATVIIAREDDATFGVLHSRFHEVWSLRLGSSLENRPRYTPTTTFETFPFPEGLTPDLKPSEYTNPHADEIATIATRLNELRENWLNPPEWTERVPEVVPGYPDRIVAKPGCEEKLKKRTLTNLYNERPTWLANVHRELDVAVAKAYDWPDYSESMTDEEILGRLLKLNLERSKGSTSSHL